MAIQFTNHEVEVKLRNKTRLKAFLAKLFEEEWQGLKGLHYIFCSDEYLLQLNKQFLKHDTYTDIVTFELSDVHGITDGEIYISIERVRENARKFKVSEEMELHRVMFHGALHLCGYKDKTRDEQNLMRIKENEYLDLYFGNNK